MDFTGTTAVIKLPVSRLEVRFRVPDGSDDLAIVEASGSPVERALDALRRLACITGREPGPEIWKSLTVTDFEAALLGLRRFLFGDSAHCLYRCVCGERLAPDFSISAFLEDVVPQLPRLVARRDIDGWFNHSRAAGIRFRLPAVQDQLEVMGHPAAESLLASRCIDGRKLNARELARVERAMESMAPLVSRPLAGNCPECGQPVTMPLHVPKLVMDELRLSAAGVHDEIHAIAAAYHWTEASILAMPQSRRRAYAETIRRRDQAGI